VLDVNLRKWFVENGSRALPNGGIQMIKLVSAVCAAALLAAPAFAKDAADNAPNTLTHGMAQMTLHVAQTTQVEVIEAFGAPNITTLDAQGQEVWIYDRHATVTASSGSSFSIGMLLGAAGGGVAGGGSLGFGSSKSKGSQSSRTMTLIIKFGPDKRVSDFKSRSSSF
jgi:ABC-type Fe3+-hydroxamate transport system substrate-binding protein